MSNEAPKGQGPSNYSYEDVARITGEPAPTPRAREAKPTQAVSRPAPAAVTNKPATRPAKGLSKLATLGRTVSAVLYFFFGLVLAFFFGFRSESLLVGLVTLLAWLQIGLYFRMVDIELILRRIRKELHDD